MQRAVTNSIYLGEQLSDVKIIPFKKEHLECMDIRPHEQALVQDIEAMAQLEKNSVACTGLYKGVLICSGGVTPFGNGNADIWLIPSVHVANVTFVFARHLRRWVFGVRKDLALSRMQSACIDDDLHNNWMSFLGFEKEGVMKKYHGGVTYNMWGQIWN
jgi:hypothetical protein